MLGHYSEIQRESPYDHRTQTMQLRVKRKRTSKLIANERPPLAKGIAKDAQISQRPFGAFPCNKQRPNDRLFQPSSRCSKAVGRELEQDQFRSHKGDGYRQAHSHHIANRFRLRRVSILQDLAVGMNAYIA